MTENLLPALETKPLARTFELFTPLGTNVLLFHGMTAREELSRLSEFQMDALSERGDIDPNQVLGKRVSVKAELPDDSFRYFNAFVTRFGWTGMEGRYYRYRATLRPWLWFLSLTTDCRVFQNKTAPEIIKEVFAKHSGVASYKLELTNDYRTRDYCVQYRETDLDFVSRLMEEEGIYYYFIHDKDANTLILADSYAAHSPFPQYQQLPFIPKGRPVRPEQEYIRTWTCDCEIRPGKYVLDDFNFEKPSLDISVRHSCEHPHDFADYEMFDYPGSYISKADGDHYVRMRVEELHARHELVNAETNARGVAVGHLVTLTNHPRSDQNREYLIVAATHELKAESYETTEAPGASYECTFTALHSKQPFRPERITPKPFVKGPQTAMVVGPAGDEIHDDEHARVKVQFHWDRHGKSDENSSCWIRVSQPWAGMGWGSVSTPRIGQEVIVDFLEGDPDRPIITGRVYNGENRPPHGGSVSGLKTKTHKGQGHNEMSMDDTAGQEKLTLHGQHNMSTTVGNDQTNTINNNQTTDVKNNRATTISVDDTLNVMANRTMSVKGKLAETIEAGRELMILAGYKENITGGATSQITGDLSRTVDGGYNSIVSGWRNQELKAGEQKVVTGDKNLTVTGTFFEDVTGDRVVTVTGPIDQSATATMRLHADGESTVTSGALLSLAVGEGNFVSIKSGEIVISAGGSTIKIDGGGVSVNGTKVQLNCG
jgi:type VI secretion system secreted protein VgrG